MMIFRTRSSQLVTAAFKFASGTTGRARGPSESAWASPGGGDSRASEPSLRESEPAVNRAFPAVTEVRPRGSGQCSDFKDKGVAAARGGR
jgi:hypothetical protein